MIFPENILVGLGIYILAPMLMLIGILARKSFIPIGSSPGVKPYVYVVILAAGLVCAVFYLRLPYRPPSVWFDISNSFEKLSVLFAPLSLVIAIWILTLLRSAYEAAGPATMKRINLALALGLFVGALHNHAFNYFLEDRGRPSRFDDITSERPGIVWARTNHVAKAGECSHFPLLSEIRSDCKAYAKYREGLVYSELNLNFTRDYEPCKVFGPGYKRDGCVAYLLGGLTIEDRDLALHPRLLETLKRGLLNAFLYAGGRSDVTSGYLKPAFPDCSEPPYAPWASGGWNDSIRPEFGFQEPEFRSLAKSACERHAAWRDGYAKAKRLAINNEDLCLSLPHPQNLGCLGYLYSTLTAADLAKIHSDNALRHEASEAYWAALPKGRIQQIQERCARLFDTKPDMRADCQKLYEAVIR